MTDNTRLKNQYKQIATDVWVWENFLSQEELAEIMLELEQQDWEIKNGHAWGIKSLIKYKQRVLDSLDMPESSLLEIDNVIRRKVGGGMEPHVDIQNYLNVAHYNEVEKSEDTIGLTLARYGMIIYLNDNYLGGEICYVEDDFCYKPNAGDLIVHDVGKVHAVKSISDGYRYTHSAYIADQIYVTKKTYEAIDWPENVDMSDPRMFYSVSHGPSLNLRLQKIQEWYVDDGTYTR
jgi:hypothetical protein